MQGKIAYSMSAIERQKWLMIYSIYLRNAIGSQMLFGLQ